MDTVTLTLRIENRYELYPTEITTPTVTVPAPPEDEDSDAYDEWTWEHIHDTTGVGHEDGDSWYDVEVTESSRPDLIPVGKTWDFGY
jgi:hypothetical protein